MLLYEPDGLPAALVLIVSRHPAAIEFIRQESGLPCDVEAVEHVTDDVLTPATTVGAPVVIYGNVPLHIAARCRLVVAVEFDGQPPRGKEYTLEDMRAAGARLRAYSVRPLHNGAEIRDSQGQMVFSVMEDGRFATLDVADALEHDARCAGLHIEGRRE